MTEYQVILLPRDNYYKWVEAAKEFVFKYGPNITPDPDTAGRFMMPDQVVTIAYLPNAYPNHGDIADWFRRCYPNVRTDLVAADSPEEFKQMLAARIAASDRFGTANQARTFSLVWPTEYPVVTQAFGVNPQIYNRWGLPGHEGIDIRAPMDSKIFCCADGTVVKVDPYRGDSKAQPYGNSVRVQHRDGYLTVYAHLNKILVNVGDVLKAGQVLGMADSTGNSSGSHLHLTLKKEGATARGETIFKNDIVDPTPFLIRPGAPPPTHFDWPAGKCLVGVHGRADGPLGDADFNAVQVGRIEAVKLTSTARPENVDRLRQVNPTMFIIVRLFADFRNRVVRSDEFAGWLEGDMANFYNRGVRYFEIHNEVNLQIEGWTTSWQDGREFAAWFTDVRNRLKAKFPEAKFGFPGLSPGGNISGQRMDSMAFLSGADSAVQVADWVGLHCYWQNETEMNSNADGRAYRVYRERYPDKVLFITEFSNPAHGVDAATKAQQYVKYFESVRNEPGLGAAFSFVLSASAYFPNEVWRLEDGSLTAIPQTIGARQFA